ncbi:unnamed protein product [Tuber aestivum]|uniref:Uncharacterized protein n=1 Tax=Tuber aestivum TaxID=59557 RepID=A0A292Q7J2_9PEZI|nr:unnamed protein product [Tuber aestivum]
MSQSPVAKILNEAPNYCSIPPELNPDERQCSYTTTSAFAFILATSFTFIVVAGYSLLRIRTCIVGKSLEKRWNPLSGCLWGAAYIIVTTVNALSMGHSASEHVTLQLFQLLLALPRFGWWDIVFYMADPEECKESAADALVTEVTIGTVALGFIVDMVLRMSPCGGAHAPIKVAAFFLPALELASLLFGYVAIGLILWRDKIKRVWILPSFVLMVAVTITSFVFWIRFEGITTHADCLNGRGMAPQAIFQLFLPMLIAFFRFAQSCMAKRSLAQPAPAPEQHELSEL